MHALETKNSRPPRIFLGGPFSKALKGDPKTGYHFYDVVLRTKIESAITAIISTGVELLNSHMRDKWGETPFESNFATRDLGWIQVCDTFICLLPLDSAGVPYRTDGTFVEIGYALSAGKDVVLMIESIEHPGWSHFIRDFASSPFVRLESLERLLNSPEHVMFEGIFSEDTLARRQVTDVRLWNWLQQQATSSVSVKVGQAELIVFPGVMNPRFSHSPDFLMSFWKIPKGARILDMGCGCGVVGINALLAGAGELLAVDMNPVAVENTNENLNRNRMQHLGKAIVSEAFSRVTGIFDVIVFNPPYWNDKSAQNIMERAAFDTPNHGFLCSVISEVKLFLAPGGRVFIAYSDQGDLSLLMQQFAKAGLHVINLYVQRPEKCGFHIRVGFEVALIA